MGFRDRIAACNRYDLARFVPFVVDGCTIGWVRRALAPLLTRAGAPATLRDGRIELDPALRDFRTRSAAMASLVAALEAEGEVTGRRDECFAAASAFGAPPLFEIERAAVSSFGLRAYGVHLTGFVRRGDGLWIWVPRRARDKDTFPGMLDNTVAGGQPIGIGVMENLIKECGEEAGIDPALARRAVATGAISYCVESARGLKRDVQFCFDLELPETFVPHAADGEVERFELWPIARVVDTVRDSEAFKPNCNLVLIDFFVRHGALALRAQAVAELVADLRASTP